MPASQHQTPKSDIEISQTAKKRPIIELAKEKLGIAAENLEPYGHYKAKVSMDYIKSLKDKKNGKLILVTAITPTPAGEGKTTTTVGLTDALNHIGKKAMLCLREPSLGPSFGMKGGAAGGGYAQVVPMEDINLHFTGDFHAITSAHNLLSALIDNHIYWGNALGIDSRRVAWRRVMDMNDRALREIVCSLGGVANGFPREDGFDITVASEVMAIFCLARDLDDLKERLGNIIVGYTRDRKPVRANDLKAHGAMTALLKDALAPNLVQTLEGTPAFIHGGPFANIAHGCNSVLATTTALKLADYVVTEAGFGADLGGEKFLDIKCRKAGPGARLRGAGRHHPRAQDAWRREEGRPQEGRPQGAGGRHGQPAAPRREREEIRHPAGGLDQPLLGRHRGGDRAGQGAACAKLGVEAIMADHWAMGGEGAADVARAVVKVCDSGKSKLKLLYPDEMPLFEKIGTIAKEIYRAKEVTADKAVRDQLKSWEEMGYGKLPICIAKTQYSFTTNADVKGAPNDHIINVREVRLSAGAEFVVAICGEIMTMPGLPKVPAADSDRRRRRRQDRRAVLINSKRGRTMIKFYYSGAPNPMKVALMLEETGLPYEAIPVDTRKGDQHKPEYLAINPNAKVPAIVDGDATVFDSNAILLYLAEKTGKFLPANTPKARGELLSWLMFVASGVGPFSGQSVHFRNYAPEKIDYAINRYMYETQRHYAILDARLAKQKYMLGDSYTIVDMAVWGWARLIPNALGAETGPSFRTEAAGRRDLRPPGGGARQRLKDKHKFKTEFDEEAKKAMFRHMTVKVA